MRPPAASAQAQQLLRRDAELDLQLLWPAGARRFLHGCQEVQPVLGRASPAFRGHLNHGAVRYWARALQGRVGPVSPGQADRLHPGPGACGSLHDRQVSPSRTLCSTAQELGVSCVWARRVLHKLLALGAGLGGGAGNLSVGVARLPRAGGWL